MNTAANRLSEHSKLQPLSRVTGLSYETHRMDFADIVPYGCVFFDAGFNDFLLTARQCIFSLEDRAKLVEDLKQMWTSSQNPNPVLPCLSVRTALDLYLTVMNFPRGSEIILSAINIPDIMRVVHHHGLKIVPLDISLDTLAPKHELLDSIVSEKTVAMLLAHIYGRWFNVEPFILAAEKHKLVVIEDCAEGFHGPEHSGHPMADLSLFSFGAIKYYTAFGGAIAKIRNHSIYKAMSDLYSTYPIDNQWGYLKKIIKYSMACMFLNCPTTIKIGIQFGRTFNLDYHKFIVELLRGFPSQMMMRIRHQPSTPLLANLHRRLKSFKPSEMNLVNCKAEYVTERLPSNVTKVGQAATVRNHWLFPIVVENADDVAKSLNALGVEAYRGATQLSIVEPDNGDAHLKHLHSFATRYPHEAKYLIDHVVYLPVNKIVPFQELDKICDAVAIVMETCDSGKSSLITPRMPNVKSKL